MWSPQEHIQDDEAEGPLTNAGWAPLTFEQIKLNKLEWQIYPFAWKPVYVGKGEGGGSEILITNPFWILPHFSCISKKY